MTEINSRFPSLVLVDTSEVQNWQIAAAITKNILRGKKNIFMPSSDQYLVPVPTYLSSYLTFSSAQTTKPLSSYTSSAFTLTLTSCITPCWMHSIVTLATLGLLCNRTQASRLREVFSGRCLIHSLSVLYLVSFDSSSRLSSGPPRPL